MLLARSLATKQAAQKTLSFCRIMSSSAESPALSFEIIARCSVSSSSFFYFSPFSTEILSISQVILMKHSSSSDHQSPRLQPSPSPRPRPLTNLHARSNPSIPERPHPQPTSPNRLQAMPQQHLPPRSQARSRDPR